MLRHVYVFFFRIFALIILLMSAAMAENEDVYMDEFIGDEIFYYYQYLAEQHNEKENDYSVANNDFYENE